MNIGKIILLVIIIFGFNACKITKPNDDNTKRQISRFEKGGMKYQVFLLNRISTKVGKVCYEEINLSIRIMNTLDNRSPLRRLCNNLNDYNSYYEYLLNGGKEDLYLNADFKKVIPISYFFENNYNVVPYETINVGFRLLSSDFRGRNKKEIRLIYTDRIFSKETITFPLLNL